MSQYDSNTVSDSEKRGVGFLRWVVMKEWNLGKCCNWFFVLFFFYINVASTFSCINNSPYEIKDFSNISHGRQCCVAILWQNSIHTTEVQTQGICELLVPPGTFPTNWGNSSTRHIIILLWNSYLTPNDNWVFSKHRWSNGIKLNYGKYRISVENMG